MPFYRWIPQLGVLLLVLGCSSPKPLTPQQKAENDAYFVERKARIAREKAAFDADVVTRTSADATAPARVSDPGYPAATCINPPPRASDYSLKVPPIGDWAYEGVICDNTTAGLNVLAWREWYCRSIESDASRVRDCVISAWSDGYQSKLRPYWGKVTKRVTFRLTASTELAFAPASWQPSKR